MVTEVAAGSGLLVPGLFDHYQAFTPRPAAFFGVPVCADPPPASSPSPAAASSPPARTAQDRQPIPWAPPALHLTGLEGAGEVQTPLTGPAAAALRVGDSVWFRHAKSGELFEHSKRRAPARRGRDRRRPCRRTAASGTPW